MKRHYITIGVGIIVVIVLILVGYRFAWTGFNRYTNVVIARITTGTNAGTSIKAEVSVPGKTVWDWLNLLGVLAIPIVVGLGAAWYTAQQGKVSERANTDNQRETALQAYIDKMSELLLHEGLRHSSNNAEVRSVATLQTLIALPRLDGKRKGSVLLFLYEAGLIEKSNPIVHLGAAGLHAANLQGCDMSGNRGASLYSSFISYADLEGANFTGMHLREVFFEGGNLQKARFIKADLRDSDFLLTDLRGTDFTGTDLTNASLVGANLTGAIISNEQLNTLKSLQDTIMPDGSKHS